MISYPNFKSNQINFICVEHLKTMEVDQCNEQFSKATIISPKNG